MKSTQSGMPIIFFNWRARCQQKPAGQQHYIMKNSNAKKTTSKNSSDSDRKAAYIEKRNALREISNLVKPLIETGEIESVNEGIVNHYKEEFGFETLKTFNQWKNDGMFVKKGSKAFAVWGSPQNIPHPDPDSEKDEMEYFPLCYLFSNQQVTERSKS